MLKIILHIVGAMRRPSPVRDLKAQWLRDPLSHPVLQGMDQRELGDLPFRR